MMQFGSYLLVGAFNTVSGYAIYALFTTLIGDVIPYGYMAAMALSMPINITVAFLGYKWFVFHTKGNYVREWLRCFVVYGGSVALSLVLLPILVNATERATGDHRMAPYIGGAFTTGFTVLVSFVGHRRITFR